MPPAPRPVSAASAAGLRRFFAAMVRPCFATLGLGTGPVADYVVDLLVRFARTDQLYRVHDSRGRRLESLTGLLLELRSQWSGPRPYAFDRELDLRRHGGDYALFLSGVFRPHVESGGYLAYYLAEGARSYRIVGERLDLLGRRETHLFRALAASFEAVSGALDYLRKVYMVPAARRGEYADSLRGFDVGQD